MSKLITVERVHIELSRVQTWLFAVPRLRAMVGANTLLGETLSVKLPKLARGSVGGQSIMQEHDDYLAAAPLCWMVGGTRRSAGSRPRLHSAAAARLRKTRRGSGWQCE